MRTRFLIAWGSLALLCAMSLLAGPARAQNYNFDLLISRLSADDPSPDTIPVGTKITLQNWQQYKKFMPLWLQAEYSGQYHWHITDDPIYTIEVGPTHNFPFPQKYQEDTEKYAGQTRLVKASSGGYTIDGYVAGQPFPNPTEPLKATKLMYNAWLIFRPSILNYTTKDWLVDQYDNVSTEDTDDTWYQMSHISEPNSPVELPFANGNLFAARYLVTAPEQSRYTTELQLQPADPSKFQESYVFLPSLRRSLRLSSAARCSPILGTDYVQDDGAWMPANFDAHYIGSKKLLTIVMNPEGAYTPSNFQGAGGSKNNTLPGWPKAGTNKWEIAQLRYNRFAGTAGPGCLLLFTSYILRRQADQHCRNGGGGKLRPHWKAVQGSVGANAPYNFSGQTTILNYTTTMSGVWDFQNKHATANNDEPATFDEAVPAALQDVATLSTPGGLASVMK